jgi:hypothetical protein
MDAMYTSDRSAADDSETGPFMLNLCGVNGPIAIPQPRSAQLSKFTFFCSRERSGGREAWWLRFGYFDTRADAEKWLERLRRVYPDASISEADVTLQNEHFVNEWIAHGRT